MNTKIRVKLVGQEFGPTIEVSELPEVEENMLILNHTDGTVEWIPLYVIEKVQQGTNQPWTKNRVAVKEQTNE